MSTTNALDLYRRSTKVNRSETILLTSLNQKLKIEGTTRRYVYTQVGGLFVGRRPPTWLQPPALYNDEKNSQSK